MRNPGGARAADNVGRTTVDEAPRRGRFDERQLTLLASHLTGRDRQIALDCFEHRVFTTPQLLRLHFSDPRHGRRRLLALYQLRVLDRFRPAVPIGQGSAPYHWVLDHAGAHLVAAHRGIDPERLRYRHAAALAIQTSTKLTHQIEVNELFTRLARGAANAGGRLAEWYGERTLHGIFDGTITPDGYGVIHLPNHPPIHLLAELDRDTEPALRLREKASRYPAAIAASALAKARPLILLAVPTAARAKAARAAVSPSAAAITVTVWSADDPRPLLALIARAASRDPLTDSPKPPYAEPRPPP